MDRATKNVLVVDDEDLVRRLARRMLTDAGYHVVEAAHGREALEIVARGDPAIDLVVTDVVMPDIDGRELGLRLGRNAPRLPIAYISAFSASDIFHRGSPRPEAPFLQKPFNAVQLVALVDGLLLPVEAPRNSPARGEASAE